MFLIYGQKSNASKGKQTLDIPIFAKEIKNVYSFQQQTNI